MTCQHINNCHGTNWCYCPSTTYSDCLVSDTWICDGTADCDNGEDEDHCGITTTAPITTTQEPCITEQNWNYGGYSAGQVNNVNQVEVCRTQCRNKPGAKYFTKDDWGCKCKTSDAGRSWSTSGSPRSGNIWCGGQ